MRALFPFQALRREVRFWLEGRTLPSERSINDVETIIPTMHARWRASASFAVRSEEERLQWQAFLAQMEGRYGTTLVPALAKFFPGDRDGHGLSSCRIADLSDAQFFEHFGLANEDVNYVRVSGSTPANSNQMDLNLVNSDGLRPGNFFSIGERLHRVQLHWQPNSSIHRIRFEPPLREAAPHGARIETAKPVCKMRFQTEVEGIHDQYMDVMPLLQVNFEEVK